MPLPGAIQTPIRPARAAVVPRGYPAAGGETLPLETHVRALLRRHPLITIVGPSGSGKTTALAHLAAVLGDANIEFIDDPTDASFLPPGRRCVLAAPAIGRDSFGVALRLALWGESERIDYLLARHPARVRAVMDRLKACDFVGELEGSPRLWSFVLDAMATMDVPADGVRSLLRAFMSSQLASLGASAEGVHASMALAERVSQTDRLPPAVPAALRHRFFCRAALVDELVSAAYRPAERFERWSVVVDETLIRLLGLRVRTEPAAHTLMSKTLADAGLTSMVMRDAIAPMVGVLVGASPAYRPAHHLRWLDGVFAPGAQWASIDLSDASMSDARLPDADLSRANLSRVNLRRADLRRANLSGAILHHTRLESAEAAEASFANADLSGADLCAIEASLADFTNAVLKRVDFRRADLRGASLRNANLTHASLTGSNLEAVDLRHAIVDHLSCHDLDLTQTLIERMSGDDAHFIRCNFAGAKYEGLRLIRCRFTGSDFTGSMIRNASFPGGNFQQAGLAEIDWEGVDLREADFTDAAFHMGTSRSGLVFSPIACEGSRTGFYTDDYAEQDYRPPEAIRKANLCGANLAGAKVRGTDWYLVDLRGARYTADQAEWFRSCGAILVDRR